MPNLKQSNIHRRSFRPEEQLCRTCQAFLKRSHIAWRKRLVFLTGPVQVVSWAYRCPDKQCAGAPMQYVSLEAESLHLKHRSYSRELVVSAGHRRFWLHQSTAEIHAWLTEDLQLSISERQVLNVLADFLALLRAAQQAKVRQQLQQLEQLVIGVDGMQPEKGNTSLYVVREQQLELTLLAENLSESSNQTLSRELFEPLIHLAEELGLTWRGVISDAQRSLRLAVASSLPAVPHQLCQFHCLRDAGSLAFAADRAMKKRLKSALRTKLGRLRGRITRLREADQLRAVLDDYAEAIQAALLTGGVAPFGLGGLRVYAALEDLAGSLTRCQKKGPIPC